MACRSRQLGGAPSAVGVWPLGPVVAAGTATGGRCWRDAELGRRWRRRAGICWDLVSDSKTRSVVDMCGCLQAVSLKDLPCFLTFG